MIKRISILAAVVLVFSACELQAEVINSKWVGPGDSAWAEPSNWSPSYVPCNSSFRTFAVRIEGGSSGVLVWLSQNCTIDELTTYGVVQITNYHLQVNQLEINGNLINNTGANLSLFGHTYISLNLRNETGAEMLAQDHVLINGDLDNAGVITVLPITWISALHGLLLNKGQINIWGGVCGSDHGIFDNTGTIQGYGTVYSASQSILNNGAIYAFGGSLTVGGVPLLTNNGILGNKPSSALHIKPVEDVNNNGTIEVNVGGGVVFDCNLVNEPNAVIKLLNGTITATTITQAAGASFVGFGGITGNLIIESDGIIKLTGPTNIVGDVTIKENAELEISDGQVIVTGHTVCNGTIHLKGGRIVPQGGLSGDCNIISDPSDYNSMEDFAFLAETWLWQIN